MRTRPRWLRLAIVAVSVLTVGGMATGPAMALPPLPGGTEIPDATGPGTPPAIDARPTPDGDPDRTWVTAYSASMQGPATATTFGAETLSGYEYTGIVQDVVPPPATLVDETIRQVLYLHYGGDEIRVQLSNLFGDAPTTLPSTTVGIRAGDAGSAVDAGSLRQVTFGGAESVTIPAGEDVLSDPIALPVEAFDHLVLSTFVPAGNPAPTVHGNAQQTFFTAFGDQTASADGAGYLERGVAVNNYAATFTTAVYYVAGVQVSAAPEARTLVTFGDSITDGFLSSGNTDSRYPDVLARRLLADPRTDHLSVANQAISGARVLRDGIGPSAFARIEREILDQPNVAGVLFLQGINDFGTAILQLPPAQAQELIDGYTELATRLRAQGIPVFIGTLTPSGNLLRPSPYGLYSTPETNAKRDQVNEWIRTDGKQVFDGVIDYDFAIRDRLIPQWIDLRYDALDNLHPNDAGYQVMADSIPLDLLAGLGA